MINGRTELIAHFGYPTKDTVTKLNDEMDFQRAMQAYLWSFPAVSNASIQASVFRDLGGPGGRDGCIHPNLVVLPLSGPSQSS